MYVWDINFVSSTQGNAHRARIDVRIRRDSTNPGFADAADAVVSGVSVTLKLFNGAGSPPSTYSGTTNKDGLFRTGQIALPNGTYKAEVIGLAHGTYLWDRDLDPVTSNGDTDMDGNNFPEQSHTIPH